MTTPSDRWYRSKVDWWVALLLGIPPIVSVMVAVSTVAKGVPAEMAWGLGSLLFVAAIYFGLIFPIRYGISSDRLTIRFGVVHKHVLFEHITEVHPTSNPLSSPALSLDRLQIQFGSGIFHSVRISPTPREQFLADLAQSAGLHREGNRLVK